MGRVIQFRVSEDEYALIANEARVMNTTMTNLIKSSLKLKKVSTAPKKKATRSTYDGGYALAMRTAYDLISAKQRRLQGK